jgi:hypothetical protein
MEHAVSHNGTGLSRAAFIITLHPQYIQLIKISFPGRVLGMLNAVLEQKGRRLKAGVIVTIGRFGLLFHVFIYDLEVNQREF